ncbi:MAG: hypothetical protein Q8M22_15050, partial [Actinomycetota bacterium]|nr:hypothetical protein [Actinomycetota bacterium]
FEPTPGQSADDALANLRAQYDERVQDFTQDQKIDALVEEQLADDEAEADAMAEETETVPADTEEADGEQPVTDEAAPDPAVTLPAPPVMEETVIDGLQDDFEAAVEVFHATDLPPDGPDLGDLI